MYCRILLLVFLLALWLPAPAFALEVQVEVRGVEEQLQKNILARLSLHRFREKSNLTRRDIDRLYRQGKEEIEKALAPFGFYRPEIDDRLLENGETYTAIFTVSPGEPVRLAHLSLEVTGPGQDQLGDLYPLFPMKVGEVLNQKKYEEGKRSVTLAAIRKGYLDASFATRELRIHRAERRAEIVLVLDTGPRYMFGKTSFTGGSVDEELMQRYLPYRQGSPYRPSQLGNLQRQLYRTEFFDRVVVEGYPDQAEGYEVPVEVELDPPAKPNRYSVGVGYATDTGARIRFEWYNRLFTSTGHQVRTSAQLGQYDSNLRLDYTIPWLDPRRDTLGLAVAYQDQSWDDTDTTLFTTGISADHKGDLLRHGVSFEVRNEDYSVGVTSGSALLFVPTYTGSFVYADDLLNTKYGLDLSASVSGASEPFGSDVSYLKAQANGKVIFSLMPGLRFIGRGALGTILCDSIDDMPPSLRFYAGGDQSIRGYGYRELGTKDDSGAVIGGRYLVIGSAEVEKNLTENWSVAAFWDVGNAVDDLSLDFEQGVGGGFRYRLPFGQVRLDIANAITEEGNPFRVHFNVGADL